MSECEAVDLLEDVGRDEREEEFLDKLEEEVDRYQDTGSTEPYNPLSGSSDGLNPQTAAYNKIERAMEKGESAEEIMENIREVHSSYGRHILWIIPNPCHKVVDEAIEVAYEETFEDIDGKTPTRSSP